MLHTVSVPRFGAFGSTKILSRHALTKSRSQNIDKVSQKTPLVSVFSLRHVRTRTMGKYGRHRSPPSSKLRTGFRLSAYRPWRPLVTGRDCILTDQIFASTQCVKHCRAEHLAGETWRRIDWTGQSLAMMELKYSVLSWNSRCAVSRGVRHRQPR